LHQKKGARVVHEGEISPNLRLELEYEHPRFCYATVVVSGQHIDTLYHLAAHAQQNNVEAPGFPKGKVPITYIEKNFTSTLIDHIKEFLFRYVVLNYLYREIQLHKLLVIGEPRLQAIYLKTGEDARFTFELTLFPDVVVQEWRYLPFKAPKRKKYKDLDRQVDGFIKEERDASKKYESTEIQVGDWVNFTLCLVDEKGTPLLGDCTETLWIKIGDEEADTSMHDLFIHKKIGDVFLTQNKGLQEYFSNTIATNYYFRITILDTVPQAYFCFESFKKYFKLKTNKELSHKLIEVFSYRNDLSQRRSMAEESLKLLLSKHRFLIPNHLILRHTKHILDVLQDNPDYQVYRVQKDFKDRVRELAEKQIKEMILLGQLAIQDNMQASQNDIKSYLTLTQRPRTKEFVYFDVPASKIDGQERPISHETLKLSCLREKALNHIIYHLTRQ
jgi:FKBP-type peptidyl-prolyl cis-trans isomerase (trigger factor)